LSDAESPPNNPVLADESDAGCKYSACNQNAPTARAKLPDRSGAPSWSEPRVVTDLPTAEWWRRRNLHLQRAH